jgi:hypothetical protein
VRGHGKKCGALLFSLIFFLPDWRQSGGATFFIKPARPQHSEGGKKSKESGFKTKKVKMAFSKSEI